MNNNFVTAETAARLKAAGFPQPEPQAGQVWYNHTGTPYCLTAASGGEWHNGEWYAVYIGGGWYNVVNPREHLIFAPGVADLLQKLPQVCVYHNQYSRDFVVQAFDCDEILSERAANKNPADALAEEWLDHHVKKYTL